jgi:DNA-binding GntR family transcriptional regulator
MSATLELIKERLDELQNQLEHAIAEGKDTTLISAELSRLNEQFTRALTLMSENKTLIKG